MPDYRITGPDGGIYMVSAPEGAAREEIMRRVMEHAGAAEVRDKIAEPTAHTPESAQPAPRSNSAIDSQYMFMRGQTLGLMDYPAAAVNYLVDKGLGAAGVKTNNAPIGSFDEALKQVRGDVKSYSDENPILANTMELAGGVTSPVFASKQVGAFTPNSGWASATKPAGALTNLVDSGLTKAADATRSSVPKLADIIGSKYMNYAAQGAAGGAASGVGLAEGKEGGLPTLGDVANSVETNAEIGTALGVSLPAVTKVGGWAAGKLKDGTQGLLDRMPFGQDTGEGRRLARAAAGDNMTADDIRKAVDAMGPEATIADVGGNIRGAAEAAANQPGASLKAAEQLPQRQYGQAERIKAAALKAAGAAHEDELVARRQVMTKPLYDDSFSPGGGPFAEAQKGTGVTNTSYQINDPVLDDILRQPEAHSGLHEGMESLRRENVLARASGEPELNPMDYALKRGENGQWEKVGKPNLRMIDAVKRGFDIMLESDAPDMVHQSTGRPTNKARQIAAFRQMLIDRTEAQLPVDPRFGTSTWTAARNQWQQMSKPIEALHAVDKVLGRARDASDVTGQLYGSPNLRAKLAGLTPDANKMGEFENVLKAEKTFADTNRAVTGNSRTAYRRAAQEDEGNDFSGAIVDLASGRPGSFVGGILKSLARSISGPSPAVADKMAPMFSTNRSEQDAFLGLMRRRGQVGGIFGGAPGAMLPPIAGAPGALVSPFNTGGSSQ